MITKVIREGRVEPVRRESESFTQSFYQTPTEVTVDMIKPLLKRQVFQK
jgi:hypothetical protein